MDRAAFDELVARHRSEVHAHCYRMLGSVQDAEDVLQEALLAAWRGAGSFEGRASFRTWLYRIATNRCLNALRDSRRRRPGAHLLPPPFDPPQPGGWDEPLHLEPFPDALLDEPADPAPGPEARYEAREAIELAFLAALQALPPRQRAVLLLRDVLGYRTDEVAEMLDTTPVSVKGALQRARAETARRRLAPTSRDAIQPRSPRETALARRFAEAFQSDDIETVLELMTEDAVFRMPPYPHAYKGRENIGEFLRASAAWRAGRRYTLLPTSANGRPAFGCYLQNEGDPGLTSAAGLIVLEMGADRIAGVRRFVDPSLFQAFGFDLELELGVN